MNTFNPLSGEVRKAISDPPIAMGPGDVLSFEHGLNTYKVMVEVFDVIAKKSSFGHETVIKTPNLVDVRFGSAGTYKVVVYA